jgi:anti-anti-sigma regulatory factor
MYNDTVPQAYECVPTVMRPTLQLMRLPGEFGLTVRCKGELSVCTAEALRRELALLEALDHPVLMVNLAECQVADVDGTLAILRSFKRYRDQGRRLIVVTGARPLEGVLGIPGIERLIPSYPTEEAAALDLRGWWPPLPGPDTWAEALAETIVHWKVVQEAIDRAPREDVLHLLTSMTGLCERAEEFYQENPTLGTARCQHCPLFHALGGGPEDVGCRSLIDPILASVRAGDETAAHAQVAGVIHTLEKMPLIPGASAERARMPA